MSTRRAEVITDLAVTIAISLEPLDHPGRVAIDGITAAGKTTLADELAVALSNAGVSAQRLSMDGYHYRAAHRHRQGRSSADGYYQDAYDFAALARDVLDPLGRGTLAYRPAILDLGTDTPIAPQTTPIAPGGVLVVDGSFLQRAELADAWDVVVWVDTPFEIAEARGVDRDFDALGGRDFARDLFRDRYHAACRRYLREANPSLAADIVFDNADPAAPALMARRDRP